MVLGRSTMVLGKSTMVLGRSTIVSGMSTMVPVRSSSVQSSTLHGLRRVISCPKHGVQPTEQHPKYSASPDFGLLVRIGNLEIGK